ncbi:adenosylcobinamide-GDP ribazoletransferase [Pseudoalteromonas luteoviolacea]|uniref:adenosylcobinamide-GDP ribazoletransferase n=1 Tax=Pseudoalteromonas luteoviolacea TaxID=43657 RepID=UPI001B378089|nr:adenosylcobinamide-GDP ribazoletransferase [Pseudoalteromonas luteoviolacea]MBQ4839195.1 adenosylcobinamide-GDP ribazoletransferase [Pseudoalteromonas luteoviolacea]
MRQLSLFKLAVVFLTRVPIKLSGPVSDEHINRATRYFACVGLCIGVLMALLLWAMSLFLPFGVVIVFTLGASLLLTGAFHEDGFADVWDGFGGGWSRQQKLDIMKDSRLGTYGSVALLILLLSKFQLMLALSENLSALLCSVVLAQTLSRVSATSLIGKLPYVQLDSQSKVKPIAKSLNAQCRTILYVTGGVVLFLTYLLSLMSIWQIVTLIATLWVTRGLCQLWFKHQLGGYTGDCLGAAQQVSEIAIYTYCVVSFL